MIFLTVGTQLPFDRLVKAADEIAPKLDEKVFGQIGSGNYLPMHFEATDELTPDDFKAKFAQARLIIGHAGIGTILTGEKLRKPLALMARRHDLGEHRNDHQMATAAQVSKINGVSLFDTADELLEICLRRDVPSMTDTRPAARQNLIDALRRELFRPAAQDASH